MSRIYARVIEKEDAKKLENFIGDYIDSNVNITIDKWATYQPLKSDFKNFQQIYSREKRWELS